MSKTNSLVIDVNCFETSQLKDFLSRGEWNVAVLTDYAGMEIYKAESNDALRQSLSILSKYPRQVRVLRSTTQVCGLSGRTKKLANRMIDWDQTRQFETFCNLVNGLKDGDDRLRFEIQDKRNEAQRHLAEMVEETKDLAIDYSQMQMAFSEAEIKKIRLNEPIQSTTWEKLFERITKMAADFFELHPNANKWPKRSEWPNTFFYRFALLQHLHFFYWIRNGSPIRLNAEKIRNDIVDLNFATFGTFFDGVMTNDQKLRDLHLEAKVMLEEFILPLANKTNYRLN